MIKFLIFSILLAGCSNTSVLNFGPDFKNFLETSRKLPKGLSEEQRFYKKIEFWNKYIEKKDSLLFKNVIWKSRTQTKGCDKSGRLQYVFKKYESYSNNTLKIYDLIEKEFFKIKKLFKQKFPDADLKTRFVILPFMPPRNASAATLSHWSKSIGFKHMIIIGADNLIDNGIKEIDHIIAHELFHVYHDKIRSQIDHFSNLQKEDLELRLALSFYREGLAEYVGNLLAGTSTRYQNYQPHDSFSFIGLKHISAVDAYTLGKKIINELVNKYGLQQMVRMKRSHIKKEMKIFLQSQKQTPKIKELIEFL